MNKILTSTFKRLKGEPNLKEGTVYSILIIISVSHFLNDMIQSVVPAIYPIIKTKFGLSFAQIGIITLVFQMSSSILQPLTGLYSDRHPRPYALSIGMCFTLAGIIILAFAGHFLLLLLAVCTIGLGSSIFHPEASRVAQLASGGRKSLAQSIFQVGGNGGSAIGPLLAAAIVLPFGQEAISWFAIAAVAASAIMVRVGSWYSMRLSYATRQAKQMIAKPSNLTGKQVKRALLILVLLIFSKYFYVACITNYFTFFLIDKFGISVGASQLCLFAFLLAFAIGTVAGGMLGDKIGRKYVIWASILAAAPPALAMPFVSLPLTVLLAFLTGLIIASAFLRHRPDAWQTRFDFRHILRPHVRPGRSRFCLLRLAGRPNQHQFHLQSERPAPLVGHSGRFSAKRAGKTESDPQILSLQPHATIFSENNSTARRLQR